MWFLLTQESRSQQCNNCSFVFQKEMNYLGPQTVCDLLRQL
jgi:hypothetical protein